MVRRVQVRNYRSLGEVDIELGPLTVLVGPNGAGKSNFVDVLRFVSDAVTNGLDTAVTKRHGITGVRRWSVRRPYDVSIRLTFGSGRDLRVGSMHRGEYALEIGSAKSGRYRVKREALRLENLRNEEAEVGFEVTGGRLTWASPGEYAAPSAVYETVLVLPLWADPHVGRLVRDIRRCGFYTIFPNELRRPQEPSNDLALDSQGRNLASVLQRMEERHDSAFEGVEAGLAAAVPGVTGVRVELAGGYLVLQLEHSTDDGETHWFSAAHESDGTLRLLGLLTALNQRPSPPLIVIEEPELTVHPGVLALVKEVIEEAGARRTQVLITTHSPELMSLFGTDVLRVVEMTSKGTKIGPLAAHQREAVRRQLFSLDEIVRIDALQREGSHA